MTTRFNRRRLALLCVGLGAVGAVGAFTFGATNALYTSQAAAQQNSITSGTVTLTENGTASKSITQTNFMPGDGSCYSPPAGATYTCNHDRNVYALNYTGTNPALVGMDIKVTSTASQPCTALAASTTYSPSDLSACTDTGSLPLFDGQSGAGDLDISLTPENGDTAHQLVLDSNLANVASCNTSASKIVTCTSVIKNIIMPVNYGADTKAVQWVTGSTDFVQVDTGLPLAAGNQFQGSNVTFTLQSHAVQWDNNNTTRGSASPVCDTTTTFPDGLTAASVPCPISWS
jgi:hypothetical protein